MLPMLPIFQRAMQFIAEGLPELRGWRVRSLKRQVPSSRFKVPVHIVKQRKWLICRLPSLSVGYPDIKCRGSCRMLFNVEWNGSPELRIVAGRDEAQSNAGKLYRPPPGVVLKLLAVVVAWAEFCDCENVFARFSRALF
jgi:hypothetical protein